MIGAGGLGYDVLTALRRLDIGAGIEAGLAIVVLAIALDRLSQAYASRRAQARCRTAASSLACLPSPAAVCLGLVPSRGGDLSSVTAAFDRAVVGRGGTVVQRELLRHHGCDRKSALLLNVLIPVKRFMVAQTWPLLVASLAFAGWQLGGARLAALAGGLTLFIALNGQWQNAMETVYLCGVSVIVASAIGIPLGIMGGLSPRFWRILSPP